MRACVCNIAFHHHLFKGRDPRLKTNLHEHGIHKKRKEDNEVFLIRSLAYPTFSFVATSVCIHSLLQTAAKKPAHWTKAKMHLLIVSNNLMHKYVAKVFSAVSV